MGELQNQKITLLHCSQAKQIEQISDAMLSDRIGFEPLKKDVESLQEELQSLMRVNYESWYEKSSSSIRSGDLT
jgi:hypothetical protein